MIREFICKKNKRMAFRTHLFGDFIKNRSEAAFAPDFQAELFPCCFLLIETCNKLLERHWNQLLLSVRIIISAERELDGSITA